MLQNEPIFRRFLAATALFLAAGAAFAQTAPAVRFRTTLGDIDVALTPNAAPLTVANFLKYVTKGAYNNTIVHRSVPGFVIQSGGFQLIDHAPVAVAEDPPVKNEFNVSNTRGTIAMAKLGSSPDSATSQWFFNLANNGANLDSQNGGFTVFGKITNNAGLAVMDRIAAQPTYNLGSAFDQAPLVNYRGGAVADSNFVLITSIVPLPLVLSAGVNSGASYAVSNNTGIAPGEILTIFGSNIGPADLTTLSVDSNGLVTNTLGGTRVYFDGTPAPLIYTSAGQIGVVAPQNLEGKSTVSVVIEYNKVTTTPISFPVAPANPGIFTLNASGTGDGAIIRGDGSVISKDNPAVPGETIALYGEGYGASSPAVGDGMIVTATLPKPALAVTLLVDDQPVETSYIGAAPYLVSGVLQVNFKVPNVAPGAHRLVLQVGDRKSPAGVALQTR